MENIRLQKVARLLQKDMGDIFRLESRDRYQGTMITVTRVRVSPDLSIAKIYVSLFTLGNSKPELILEQLKQDSRYLRGKLGDRIRHQLRVVPELIFYIDDTLDYVENIENLLKK